MSMSYQLYRNTTLGVTLQEAIDDMLACSAISTPLAGKILFQFDRVINEALAKKTKTRLSFKAGHLKTYRFCDNVWTFVLKEVEFREGSTETIKADKVKIVACDGKTEKGRDAND